MAGRATKDTVTVRLDGQKHAELDAWRIARISDGSHQAEAGDFASPEEVEAGYARWG